MKVFETAGRITFQDSVTVSDELGVGNYLLNYSQNTGFFLTREKGFVLPRKIYGDMSESNRWIKSFENNSTKNLGILLSGIKGTGKTVMAKKFCVDRNRPTVMITAAYEGPEFIKFISNPCLRDCNIFIDEFEKVYPDFESQKQFLTIMDGVYETRLIFILTSNSHDFNGLFFNRLERIKYHKSFKNLESKIVTEIINDMLNDKSYTEDLLDVLDTLQINSYDLLISIIKECNLFNEPPSVCAKYLNLKKEETRYTVMVVNGNKTYYGTSIILKSLKKGTIDFSYRNPKYNFQKAMDDEDYDVLEYLPIKFDFEGAKRVSEGEYSFTMTDKNGITLEFSAVGQYKGYRED